MKPSAWPTRGQQDVAAGLVGLRLEREPQAVALVLDVGREEVDALAVAVEGGLDVLGHVDLGAFATAPHHVGLGAELGRQIHVAHHLAQRVTTDAAVVAGEAAVLEHRMGEEVGGHHRHDETGLLECCLEASDLLVAGGGVAAERDQVVVVEGDAIGAEVGRAGAPSRSGRSAVGSRRRTGPAPASPPSTARR